MEGLAALPFFLLFFLTQFAFAIPVARLGSPECLIQNVGFSKTRDSLQELNMPLSVMGSTPLIEFYDTQGVELNSCSSTIVSDEGHILTAGHCVERCLAQQNVYEKKGKMSVVNQQKLEKITCQLRINDQPVLAQVLATNDCKAKEWNNQMPSECGADFAILKLESNEALEGAGCLKVSSKKAVKDTKVGTISYPSKTDRNALHSKATDSDGQSQYASFGKIIPYTKKCKVVQDSSRGEKVKWIPILHRYWLADKVNAGQTYQTTVDISIRSSGSGLLNLQTGEVIGIASSYTEAPLVQECEGSTFFASTNEMFNHVAMKYPHLDLNQVLKCDKRNVVGGTRL